MSRTVNLLSEEEANGEWLNILEPAFPTSLASLAPNPYSCRPMKGDVTTGTMKAQRRKTWLDPTTKLRFKSKPIAPIEQRKDALMAAAVAEVMRMSMKDIIFFVAREKFNDIFRHQKTLVGYFPLQDSVKKVGNARRRGRI